MNYFNDKHFFCCFLQIFQGKGNRLDGKTKGLEIADQSSGNGTAKRFVDKKI